MAKSKKNNENLDKETNSEKKSASNDTPITEDQDLEKTDAETNKEEDLLEEVQNLKDQLLRSLAENEG